jgi:hypothetical protein
VQNRERIIEEKIFRAKDESIKVGELHFITSLRYVPFSFFVCFSDAPSVESPLIILVIESTVKRSVAPRFRSARKKLWPADRSFWMSAVGGWRRRL